MTCKIVNLTGKDAEIELTKRQHVPAHVEDDCPKCGEHQVIDLTNEYLSYPRLGVPEALHFYCEKCDHEWSLNVIVRMTLEVAP